jgi:hypothetical protein
MDWFKKHTDALIVLSSVVVSMLWINSQINDLKKDLIVIKTVLIMKNIMPIELAHCQQEEK